MLVTVSLALLYSCKEKTDEKSTEETMNGTEVVSENGDFCYLKVISRDSIILNFTRKGDSISGNFKWLPYEKDKKRSTFKGTVTRNTANATGVYQAEGMEYEEELIFTIEGNTASVKFGEMMEADNGVWKYKNINKTSTEVLNKIDCK